MHNIQSFVMILTNHLKSNLATYVAIAMLMKFIHQLSQISYEWATLFSK